MSRRLPASVEAIGGLRAARWIRESTAGQYDNFGPDAQREQQDRAIARYGLIDSGLNWSVAASGWKDAWLTPDWLAMLEAARQGSFDILVVGYVSRFLRNLKQTLIAVEDHLHPVGVAVLFVDERLLTSDPDHWEQFTREAHESESYSRKLSKRVGEGYASKRRRLGVPGGSRAPYGIVREGRPSVLRLDEEKAAVVRQAYELAATGKTDLEVADRTGLAKTHVGEILTNPIYAGRLRTGEPAGIAALIEPALWSAVQAARERRRTRAPGRIVRRAYALRLRCSGCGQFLHGDTGRYRHPAPTCLPFLAARPKGIARRGGQPDRRTKGHSYPQDWYESAIGSVLASIGRVGNGTIAEVVRLHGQFEPRSDELALARIRRARDEAGRRVAMDRDIATFQAAMGRLDAEEAVARQTTEPPRISAAEIVAYMRTLPTLWEDSGPAGRQALALAIFKRVDVLGFRSMEIELTDDAVDLGLDLALQGAFDLGSKVGGFGRGERI